MSRKRTIIKGAFILTITGFFTRIIGFFYRIFLSQTFGEESVGIYQLVFPIFALTFSLSAAGLQTAISRSVASQMAAHRPDRARSTLSLGNGCSLIIACLLMLLIQQKADVIAISLLNEPRCEEMLIVLSYALPFASLHSCICGYYLGLKQTRVPAVSQILEQLARVFSVFILYYVFSSNNFNVTIKIAVVGLLAGEFAASSYCVLVLRRHFPSRIHHRPTALNHFTDLRELVLLSAPLTGSRVLLNVLQSIEAVSIPLKLQVFGLDTSQALSIYGVLTGMALPCILFPSAITNSIASMMLPTISEMQSSSEQNNILSLVKKVGGCCFALGMVCCTFLLIAGPFIGNFFFHSSLAGNFIITLAWMCPFLYTNGNLISIINGLGMTMQSFIFNTLGLLIRIASIFFWIPLWGIHGYLIGLLISQLVIFLACCSFLYIHLASRKRGLPKDFL